MAVPLGVVTVTVTVPVPAGAVIPIFVAVLLLMVAALLPNFTPFAPPVFAPTRLVPVMITLVPAARMPDDGEMPVIDGAAKYVYWSFTEVADVPAGVVTVTSTVPEPAGLVAVICVALLTVKLAVVLPNFTAVAPVKPVPVMITLLPPIGEPAVGEMLDTTGVEARTVNPPDFVPD